MSERLITSGIDVGSSAVKTAVIASRRTARGQGSLKSKFSASVRTGFAAAI